MHVSVFYENVRTGAMHDGISMVEAVSSLCASGLRGVYAGCETTARYARELDEVMEKTGVQLTGLHAWVSLDEGTAEARAAIDQAARLGANHMLLVPVCRGNDVETLAAGMRDAVDYGQRKGVGIYMEDLDQADSPYNSMDGLELFLNRIPGLNCCFDTGNWIMRQEDEVEAFRRFRGRIRAMHLKDRALAPQNPDDPGKRVLDGSCRYPAPVGRGCIRMGEILAMAGDIPAIVELYDYSPARMLEGIKSSIEWVVREESRISARR